MRQAVTGIMGCLAVMLAVVGPAGADDADCGMLPNPFVVTNANSSRLSAGFDCDNIVLEIRANITFSQAVIIIEAASILVESANPVDPAQRIQMVNDFPGSDMRINARSGGIIINGGSLKAHKLLKFTCFTDLCPFTSTQSDLIAATSFAQPLGAGGTLSWQIKGPIHITNTNVHGGDNLEMISSQSSITLICGGSVQPCKDPNVPPIPDIIKNQCGDPIVFPCNPVFNNALELREVCIGADAVQCNGGHKEKRFTAFTDINVENSTIISDEHVTFTCQTGNFFGTGLTFDMDSVRIDCKGSVDISNAKITTPGNTTIVGGTSPTACTDPAAVCINAFGAQISANPIRITAKGGTRIIDACAGTFATTGTSFPVLNNDSTPPYGNNTKDTTAECAPEPPGEFCKASGCVTN